jgi:hypothetical protein
MQRKISPSMRPELRHALPELYEGARKMAAASLDAEPDLGRRLPKECPYDWTAVIERDVMAEVGIDLYRSEEERQTKRRRTRKA